MNEAVPLLFTSESFLNADYSLDSPLSLLLVQDNTQALAAPVMLDYFDPKAPASELAVTFYNCLFTSNTFFGRPAQSSLVVGNSRQNRLIFERCLFSNNDMVSNNRDVSLYGSWVQQDVYRTALSKRIVALTHYPTSLSLLYRLARVVFSLNPMAQSP